MGRTSEKGMKMVNLKNLDFFLSRYASILGYPLNIRVSWPHIAMTRFLHTLRYSNVAAENPAIIDDFRTQTSNDNR